MVKKGFWKPEGEVDLYRWMSEKGNGSDPQALETLRDKQGLQTIDTVVKVGMQEGAR